MAEKDIHHIVLTGGDCAGKSTAQPYLVEKLNNFGCFTIFIPEVATEIMAAGIKANMGIENKDFQKHILLMQLEKENRYLKIADDLQSQKIVVISEYR